MRLYNGCPDSTLQAIIDARMAAHNEALKLGLAITYFPAEGQWSCYRKSDYATLSDFCDSPQEALASAKLTLSRAAAALAGQHPQPPPPTSPTALSSGSYNGPVSPTAPGQGTPV